MLQSSGVLFRYQSKPKKTARKLGRGLILGGVLVLTLLVGLPIYFSSKDEATRQQILKSNRVGFADLLRLDSDNVTRVNQKTYFSLEIPKIGAVSQVIPNTSAANKNEYTPVLKEGIAHAAGTYLPGMGGSVTLFAHSTDITANVGLYNAVFYRLDELVAGDEIIVWYLGEKLTYVVTGSSVLPPTNVEAFTANRNGEKLLLVTCTPRGTTRNRLVVEAALSQR